MVNYNELIISYEYCIISDEELINSYLYLVIVY